MRTLRLLFLLVLLLALASFIFLAANKDPEQWLISSIEHIIDRPLTLVLIITLITIGSTLAGLPILYLAITLGYAFGFTGGLLLSWLINLLAVMITFTSVRYLFADYFRRMAERKKFMDKLNTGLDRYGLFYVAIARSVYIIPTNIINYGFALTRIRGRAFLAGTALGLIPESVINVLAGVMIKKEVLGVASGDVSLLRIMVIFGFVLLALILLLVIRRNNKRNGKA